jgi:hypothetical protein
MDFIFQRELGIDKDGIVVIEAPTTGLEDNGNFKMLQFVEYLRGETRTVATLSANALGEPPQMVEVRNVGSAVSLKIDSHGGVDEHFIPLHDIHLVAGRNFREGEKDPVTILSRHAIERLGFLSPQVAVGKRIEFRLRSGREIIEIIGVMEDYRVTPLYNIELNSELASGRGQCLTYLNNIDSLFVPARISVRFGEPDLKSNISKVRGRFDNFFPGNGFHWSTLDAKIRGQYSDHEITRTQITSFTVIVIAVACIGILGTMSNNIVRKTKEITIRKIFGADSHHIAAMLLKTTTFQIMIAAAVGWPIAWKFSIEYLQRFTDKSRLPGGILRFLFAFCFSL